MHLETAMGQCAQPLPPGQGGLALATLARWPPPSPNLYHIPRMGGLTVATDGQDYGRIDVQLSGQVRAWLVGNCGCSELWCRVVWLLCGVDCVVW